MTDATKWKSVMLRVDTYSQLKEIAASDKRSIASILSELVKEEWEWRFASGQKKIDPTHIVKKPERIDPESRTTNPFLRRA